MADNKSKIKFLDNDFMRANKNGQKADQRLARIHRRRLIGLTAVLAIIIIFFSVQLISTKVKVARYKQETTVEQTKLEKAKMEQKDLKFQVEQLNDNDYLLKLIREKYYFSKKGETVYSFPSDKTNLKN
ncbi:FtsB family cell division protein [Dellaglioa algida]|uniref:Dihydroorotate dehydrogenase n=1 Tax=Dellaglioa algida TaxID=105612 RepID=A0A5C6MD44_9LACO|nr:septum formation initiator family protein [Dellaglioa algida]MDK1717331.1 septum formation initiator family protein [Dellaglioa algida]MDK1720655.1 septum formation initiator family protein [Dellaglioa algida]MDK1722324.1 septum formation initiator family protein [Dellaglioa algida]MDK1723948.1 septum formation initiator family protein [Dellaglioa algida]MDK1725529.1 septum formation initiator family protein [Dellaglioa algida]